MVLSAMSRPTQKRGKDEKHIPKIDLNVLTPAIFELSLPSCERKMFGTLRRLESLTLPINGTVAVPWPNTMGALVTTASPTRLYHTAFTV